MRKTSDFNFLTPPCLPIELLGGLMHGRTIFRTEDLLKIKSHTTTVSRYYKDLSLYVTKMARAGAIKLTLIIFRFYLVQKFPLFQRYFILITRFIIIQYFDTNFVICSVCRRGENYFQNFARIVKMWIFKPKTDTVLTELLLIVPFFDFDLLTAIGTLGSNSEEVSK